TLRRIVLLAAMATSAAWADTQTFDPGSLIIPMSASFQTACGAVSSYGLIWRILQSNQAGHLNGVSPVTIYWVINGAKGSPNRCVPTNMTSSPSPNRAGPSGAANRWDDPKWNDGCDLTVQSPNSSSHMPVVPVNALANPNPISGLFPYASLILRS